MLRKSTRFKLAALNTEDGTFEGYASVFGAIDTYNDVVAPGAYADTLATHAANGTRPKMLLQHDGTRPVGSWLEMREDATGLWCKGRLLLDVTAAKEAHVLLKAGELDGLSIGYEIVEERFAPFEEFQKYCQPGFVHGYGSHDSVRVLMKLHLVEVSLVTWGACPGALVDVASVKQPTASDPDLSAIGAALARRGAALTEFRF